MGDFDLVNSDASSGELAWIWGKGHDSRLPGAPGHPRARGLYYKVGFRPFTRDAPLIKAAV